MAFQSAALQEHIRGMREASAKFRALPDVVRDRMLNATEVTVMEIARGAKARLERSPSIRTRALLNAVAWSISKKTGRGRAGIANAPGTTPTGRPDNPRRRAHFIEFGTVKMPAEPFMVPAADSQKLLYLDRCMREGPAIERDMVSGRFV